MPFRVTNGGQEELLLLQRSHQQHGPRPRRRTSFARVVASVILQFFLLSSSFPAGVDCVTKELSIDTLSLASLPASLLAGTCQR